MDNNKIKVKFDNLFILLIEKKFKIHSLKKIKIIPEARIKINNLVKELNNNKITIFLRYGHLSFLLCFISIFLFIIFGLLNINFLLLFPIVMFILGMFLMPVWQIFINKWILKSKNIINSHRYELNKFYDIIDDNIDEDYSYKAKYKLIPKIEFGFVDVEDEKNLEKEDNFLKDLENDSEFEEISEIPIKTFKIRGTKLESCDDNNLKDKLIL